MSKQTVEDLIEERGGGTGYHDIMKTTGELQGVFKDQNITSARRAYLNILCHKMARLIHGYGDDDDNLLDIAGYSELERRDIPDQQEEITGFIGNRRIGKMEGFRYHSNPLEISLYSVTCNKCAKSLIATHPPREMCRCVRGLNE